MNRLFLLDAWALFYKANFVFSKSPRMTSARVNTSTVYGFISNVLDIINTEKPTHMAIAYESKSPTFRHVEYTPYKSHRPPAPESIIDSLPYIEKIISAMKIPICSVEGFEADDVIGTLAWKANDKGFRVYMVTPDKDYGQLVRDGVYMYNPSDKGDGSSRVLDSEGIKQKYGIRPEIFTDFLGLTGDSSDNIPGIPKVGEKTAIQLLEEFGTLENIILNADKITKKSIKESVQNYAEQGKLSKYLATIRTDVPIEFNPDELALEPFDLSTLKALFHELEFKTLLKRVPGMETTAVGGTLFSDLAPVPNKVTSEPEPESAPPSNYQTLSEVDHDYKLIKTEEEINRLINTLMQAEIFSFDTETTSLHPNDAELVGMSFSYEKGKAFFVSISSDESEARGILSLFKPLFEDYSKTLVAQNFKYDLQILKKYGITQINNKIQDTMLAHYVCHSNARHNMDTLARHYLNYHPISFDELITDEKGKKTVPIREVDLLRLTDYACEDADITLQLSEKLIPEVEHEGLNRLLYEVELPLIPVLADMEFYGIKVDVNFLKEYSLELSKMIKALESEIYTIAEVEFNINSPKQLGEILFDKFKLGGDKIKKTKTGQYATGEEILVELAAGGHPLPAKVVEYRQSNKLKSTYVDAIPELLSKTTGRIHTNFNQAVAVTGRLSSNNPNLQNIPIRTDMGKEVRKAFIASDENYTLLSADYSQIELRIMAALSKDEAMTEAFRSGQDIHTATAAKVFNVSLDDVTSDLRRKAKMVNFGLIYGITSFGLSARLGISKTEAKSIMDSYFGMYSGIKEYMERGIQLAKERGYAETIMGRKHYLPDLYSNNPTVRGFAERNAINTPIQGTAADMIKLAMIKVHQTLKSAGLKTKMMLQVHDELLFDVPKQEVSTAEPLIRTAMEQALDLGLPIEVNIGYGANWLDAH